MPSSGVKEKQRHIARFVGQLAVLILCLGILVYYYSCFLYPNYKIQSYFEKTNCFVSSKKLSSERYLFRRYRADFLVSYRTADAQYTQWVSGNGYSHAYSFSSNSQIDILSQYEIGDTYPCWYDPAKPERAVLALKSYALYPLVISVMIALVVLYLLWQKVSLYWQMMSKPKRQKKSKKSR